MSKASVNIGIIVSILLGSTIWGIGRAVTPELPLWLLPILMGGVLLGYNIRMRSRR